MGDAAVLEDQERRNGSTRNGSTQNGPSGHAGAPQWRGTGAVLVRATGLVGLALATGLVLSVAAFPGRGHAASGVDGISPSTSTTLAACTLVPSGGSSLEPVCPTTTTTTAAAGNAPSTTTSTTTSTTAPPTAPPVASTTTTTVGATGRADSAGPNAPAGTVGTTGGGPNAPVASPGATGAPGTETSGQAVQAASTAAAAAAGPALSGPFLPVGPTALSGPFAALPGGAAIAGGPRSTLGVLDLVSAANLTPTALARIVAPFPVAGPASYDDDFGSPRDEPYPHPHQGTDITASAGTPVVASAAGVVHLGADPAGGNTVTLQGQDGVTYFFAHLVRYSPELTDGARVAEADILGAVGTSGDATGPHLHFEVHPAGGPAVDPAPYLDRWLAQALQTARAIGGGPLLAAGVGGAALLDPVTTAARAGRSQGTHLHALNASRNTAGAATLPIAAAALAAGTWLVLRRRSLRHLAAAVAGAPADRTPSGFDPFDPVWPAPVATRVRRKGDDRRGLRDV